MSWKGSDFMQLEKWTRCVIQLLFDSMVNG